MIDQLKNNEAENKAQTPLTSFLDEISTIHSKKRQINLNLEFQLERLTSEKFQNPYDVLQLGCEALEEEIKKSFRQVFTSLYYSLNILFQLSFLVHPDKCRDSRASESFHVLDLAYKTLLNADKRKVYQRVMREAKERVEFERNKENKRREKQGQPSLPDDTFDCEVKVMEKKLFDDIEERKLHFMRLEESQKQRKKEEAEEKKLKEQYRQLSEEEWEKTRDERVSNWRKFSKKSTTVVGTKKSKKEIRAPGVKMEERPASANRVVDNQGKPMGIMDDYKKSWK